MHQIHIMSNIVSLNIEKKLKKNKALHENRFDFPLVRWEFSFKYDEDGPICLYIIKAEDDKNFTTHACLSSSEQTKRVKMNKQ